MEAPYLTKSLFQAGRQCAKRLWLEIHRRDVMEWTVAARMQVENGIQVGEAARALFGSESGVDHIKVSDAQFDKALAETSVLLSDSPTHRPILFEAAFAYEGVRVRVDALLRFLAADRLIEVKAGASLQRDYLWDCALQTWVLRGAGRPVQTISLGLVDTAFTYTHENDYQGLLALVDCTQQVEALLPEVPLLVAKFQSLVAGQMPPIDVGQHCTEPNECPFLRHCRSTQAPRPAYPLEDLPRVRQELIDLLKGNGFTDLCQVPLDALDNPLHRRIAHAAQSGEVFVSTDFATALEGIAYPRHYLDFETIAFTVPRWIGTRPYQQVPFQFSCHVEHADGRLEHRAFLDLTGNDPRAEFTTALLTAVGASGPIVVWNKAFEITRLKELAILFPDHASTLLSFVDRIVDLMEIYKKHYYHRDMHGSWSIKKVLTTIAPDLDYGMLEVGDGNMAQMAYRRAIAQGTPEAETEAIRVGLLTYCERDTYAMVRLARWRNQ